jgi:Mrp family chromosome partitioning ATPase
VGEIADALRRAGRNAEPSSRRDETTPAQAVTTASGAPDASAARGTSRRVIESPANATPISLERDQDWESRAVVVEQEGPVAESFRHLALRLQRELPPRSRSLAVVSALRGEGKTTIASNLALAMASLSNEREVALVDLDLRRPSISNVLGLETTVGIDDVLATGEELRSACHVIDKPRLDVYPTRIARELAHEILLGGPLQSLIRDLEQRYRLVILDTPPVVLVPDAQIISQYIGGCLAVGRYRQTRLNAFASMLKLLPKGKVLGAVWNEGKLVTGAEGYYYYREPQTASS